MFDFIYYIPEEIGWILVGVFGTIAAVVGYKDVKLVCEMIRGWRNDTKDDDTYFD